MPITDVPGGTISTAELSESQQCLAERQPPGYALVRLPAPVPHPLNIPLHMVNQPVDLGSELMSPSMRTAGFSPNGLLDQQRGRHFGHRHLQIDRPSSRDPFEQTDRRDGQPHAELTPSRLDLTPLCRTRRSNVAGSFISTWLMISSSLVMGPVHQPRWRARNRVSSWPRSASRNQGTV